MTDTLNKLKYWIFVVWLALRWIPKVNLGDIVIYNGERHVVANGTISDSWRLYDLDNGCDGWVPRSECRKVWTVPNMYGSFRSGYQFYMTCWYDIWWRNGVQDWMRLLPIWGKND